MGAKRWILLGAPVLFTALVIWIVLSLRNEDSLLSVVAKDVSGAICWSPDSNTACVLKTMAKYEKKGRYDEAAKVGADWAEKSPTSFTSGLIYRDISASYLKRAKMDNGHAEQYLTQAALYRDKAVPSASDSPYQLLSLAALSESVGDLSTTQRCIEYRDAMKLLDRASVLANEDKNRLARQFKPDVAERKKVECLLDWINEATKSAGNKLSVSACQQKQCAGMI